MESNENIYSSVEEKMEYGEKQREALRQVLMKHPNKWFKSTELCRICGFKASKTEVQVRKAITELIEEEKLAIISSTKGYCLVHSARFIDNYITDLRSRVAGINRRINSLEEIKKTMPDYKPDKDWTRGFERK